MHRKVERVNKMLRNKLSSIIREKSGDPAFEFVVINAVKTSPDLAQAQIFFTLLNQDGDPQQTAAELNRARGHFQQLLSQSIKTRKTPRLDFIHDSGLDKMFHIDQLLKEINK